MLLWVLTLCLLFVCVAAASNVDRNAGSAACKRAAATLLLHSFCSTKRNKQLVCAWVECFDHGGTTS